MVYTRDVPGDAGLFRAPVGGGGGIFLFFGAGSEESREKKCANQR